MVSSNPYQKIIPFVLFIAALVLLFSLIRPMITILLTSVLLAYISFPLHKKINKKILNESLSIFFSLVVIVILVLIPLSFLLFEVTQQGYYFYDSFSNNVAKGAVFGFGCESADSEICLFINRIEKFSLEKLSNVGFDKQLQSFVPLIEARITAFILSIPIILAETFLMLVIAFFIMKDWKNILKKIVDIVPMRKKTVNRLIEEFGNITHTVVYAQLFVALVQGIIATIGFYIFGVSFPIFFGILVAFCALIPAIGTAIIWVPASVVLIIMGYFTHNYWVFGKGIALFLYGLLIISTIDNFLLAKIVQKKAKVNQIIVIVGVIGGASMFGIAGVFIGPILLPLLITYFETFKERFN